MSDTEAGPGDSGGAVIQGEKAVGVVSGGSPGEFLWSTRLVNALELTDGYTVALDLDVPVVESPEDGATVARGSDIVVSVPEGDLLSVWVNDGDREDYEVEDGTVTFPAPAEDGEYTLRLAVSAGFNVSDVIEHTISVEDIVPNPTVDATDVVAAEGEFAAEVTLTGTGVPGATVNVGESDTSLVGDDGTWELTRLLDIGSYEEEVTQTLEGKTSGAATAAFTVAPAAPVVTSIEPNQSFPEDSAPTEISGTGLAGADVTVTVDGTEYTAEPAGGETGDSGEAGDALSGAGSYAAVADDGSWSVDISDAAVSGTHNVSVTQTFAATPSAATSFVYTVEAAAVTPPGGGGGEPTDPEDPSVVTPVDQPTDGGAKDPNLATTGSASMLLPYGITALALLILGAGATLLAARKLKPAEFTATGEL